MTSREDTPRPGRTTAKRRLRLVAADAGSPSRVVRAMVAGRTSRRWMYLAIAVLFALVLTTHHRADDLADLNAQLAGGVAKGAPTIEVAPRDLEQAIRVIGPGSDSDRKKSTPRRH